MVSKVVLVARIWWSFIRIRIELLRHPLPLAVQRINQSARRGRLSLHPRRLGRIVYRVLRVGPWRARCLYSSLVLYRLLPRDGGRPELVIGMPEHPEDEIAHAWIELDGADVGPPPGSSGHQELARFP